MKLKKIHQIEVTTRCNLRCRYCPHPTLKRAKRDMDMRTFYRAMDWVKHYIKKGTQDELAFTGMGEALLNDHFLGMLAQARHIYDGFIHFSTNGILFDSDTAMFCKDYDIKVFVSAHRPEVAGPAVELARKFGVLVGVNTAFIDSALDFAGSVKWENSAPKNLICSYQKEGWGMILADGTINTCCWEPEGLNAIGHIDMEIDSVDMRPMPECDKCALIIEKETANYATR